jgi:hypothetical protein
MAVVMQPWQILVAALAGISKSDIGDLVHPDDAQES